MDGRQVTDWMVGNLERFRERMKSAPQQRRHLSHRRCGRTDLPPATDRLQPVRTRWKPPDVSWIKILWGRDGWHSIKPAGKRVSYIYLISHDGQTSYVDLSNIQTGPFEFTFDAEFDLQSSLWPLKNLYEEVVEETGAAVVKVFEVTVVGAAACVAAATGAGVSKITVTGVDGAKPGALVRGRGEPGGSIAPPGHPLEPGPPALGERVVFAPSKAAAEYLNR